jgi:hypothetical protein
MFLRWLYILISVLLLLLSKVYSQNFIIGNVYEKQKIDNKVHFVPLVGASVYWKDTNIGTTTDAKGKFKLKLIPETRYLVISYVGYKSDTIRIAEGQKDVNVVLQTIEVLNEVDVLERQKGEYIDKINPIKTEIITTAGLQKLACCNLSESFENSGTVDVNYSDAVTGAKHIQMLGLAGIYSQLLGENMPLLNYLSYSHGLTFIPGTWMQSIQVSKGTSSVTNGFESITGQINVEFKKPHLSDPFFFNIYVNNEGRTEVNADASFIINDKLSSGTLVHLESQLLELDHNKDGFLDVPINRQVNIFQRFNYEKDDKYCFQYGFKYLLDEKNAGQKNFNHKINRFLQNYYGTSIKNERMEILSKHGFILPRKFTSLGLQLSTMYHNQKAYFGHNEYNAKEKFLYFNLIFNTYLFTNSNKIDVGSSYVFSDVEEDINIKGIDTIFKKINQVPGLFAQYSFNYNGIISIILGFRTDYSTLYSKWIYTPRLHVKYDIYETTSLRLSLGKGSRFSIPVAENMNYIVSSRTWIVSTNNFLENAWNYGLSLSNKIKVNNDKSIHIVADYFRTDFKQQLVIDFVTNPQKLLIYQSNSKSFSNNYQLNISFSPLKRMDISIIGRYNDVRQTYNDLLQIKPMVVPFKILATFSYSTLYEKWLFDITNQWNSSTVLPNLSSNPIEYRIPSKSNPYLIIHAQITRRFKKWDIYTGVENALNYKLKKPILAYDDPFGPYFDASLVYAPIIGRMFYAGIRYKLNKK